MSTFDFWQVDAFTDEPFKGNPCAVVFDAEPLDSAAMQAIAREMNLSETVFLMAPDRDGADYHARIFTPATELPFAGHPTLATAYSVHRRQIYGAGPDTTQLRQQCGVGIVPVDIETAGGAMHYVMTQMSPTFEAVGLGRDRLAAALGLARRRLLGHPVEKVSTGVPWLVAFVKSAADVARIRPDMAEIVQISLDAEVPTGLAVAALESDRPDCRIKVRCFAPAGGVPEDPVTGSAQGCIGAAIAHHDLIPARGGMLAYVAAQGAEMKRDGLVHVRCSKTGGNWAVQVGGAAVKVIEGSILV